MPGAMSVMWRVGGTSFLWMAVALGLGCAPQPEILTEADLSRLGAFGEDGPLGAALYRLRLVARGDRPVDVDVIVGVDDDGDVIADQRPVLFVQGGSAAVDRYHWLGAHLATRGAFVVSPHFLGDLAFFSSPDGDSGLDAALELSASDNSVIAGAADRDAGAVVIGHSLGGVVGADIFLDDATENDGGRYDGLALLCSYPNPARTITRRAGRVVSIAAEDDGLVDVEEVGDGVAALDDGGVEVKGAVVAGLTHYQLTDDPSADELAKEGRDQGDDDDRADARRRAMVLIDALREAPAFLDDAAGWPAGLAPLQASSTTATTVAP